MSLRVASIVLMGSILLVAAGCSVRNGGNAMQSEETRTDTAVVDLYFIRVDPDQEYLERVTREVPIAGDAAETAMKELIKGPDEESGLRPVLPASTGVLSCETAMGVCVIDLSREAIVNGMEIGPSATREKLVLGAIANTVTGIGSISLVVLKIEGEQRGTLGGYRIENFWGHVKLPQGLERDENLVGRKETTAPAWQGIDRMALAEAWGWREVSRGGVSSRRMAITIDGGSGGDLASPMLDTLKDSGVRCTFFLTGQFMQENLPAVVRMVEEGHEIGNHSYDHPHFGRIDESQVVRQIASTEEVFSGLSGQPMQPYFRFPYGERGVGQIEVLRRQGYLSVMWTVDSMGWDKKTPPETVYSRVMKAASPGAIVLLHFDSVQDAQILPDIIRDLRGLGYELVTVTELLYPGP